MSNIPRVSHVADKLGDLRESFVFVGGGIIELHLDDEYPLEPRISYDVDTVIEVYGHHPFTKIENHLRQLGFVQDMHSGVICRWSVDGIQVDIMPTDPNIFGFTNKWYELAVKEAQSYPLRKDLSINLISAPYLIATKLEAFKDRGKRDFLGSHDLEDIITIFDGKSSLNQEIQALKYDHVKNYIRKELHRLLSNDDFFDALPGHLAPYGPLVNKRVSRLKHLLQQIGREA